jgi:Holliday junction resolvase
MAINSKQKGARFERLLASKFREQGYDARRTAQYCGNSGDAADVTGLPGIHVEAKHAEQMRLYEWMAQAKRDAAAGGGNALPTVFHKKNHAEILVTMELDDWFCLFREWEAGHDLQEKNNEQDDSPERG